MESIKEPDIIAAAEKKLARGGVSRRKLLTSVLIAVGAAAVMFTCYLMVNGRIELDGMITILILCIFTVIFTMSLMERFSI